jgi:hypothetical protein
MNPDVATYVNAFKKLLDNNEKIREYFLADIDEETFFEFFIKIAEKNFKKFGEPQLDKQQLEILRRTVQVQTMNSKLPGDLNLHTENRLFVKVPNFGFFSLN